MNPELLRFSLIECEVVGIMTHRARAPPYLWKVSVLETVGLYRRRGPMGQQGMTSSAVAVEGSDQTFEAATISSDQSRRSLQGTFASGGTAQAVSDLLPLPKSLINSPELVSPVPSSSNPTVSGDKVVFTNAFGLPVFPFLPGTVVESGFRFGGTTVTVQHPFDLRSSYSGIRSPVAEGQLVGKGPIGYGSRTVVVGITCNGQPCDPSALLGGKSRSA